MSERQKTGFHFIQKVADNATTTNDNVRSKIADVYGYSSVLVFVQEDNANAIKFTVQGKADRDDASIDWVDIGTEQTVDKDATATITSSTDGFADLDAAWSQMSILYKAAVAGSQGRVHGWINRRRK